MADTDEPVGQGEREEQVDDGQPGPDAAEELARYALRVAELESQLEAAATEVARLKAANYDLLEALERRPADAASDAADDDGQPAEMTLEETVREGLE